MLDTDKYAECKVSIVISSKLRNSEIKMVETTQLRRIA